MNRRIAILILMTLAGACRREAPAPDTAQPGTGAPTQTATTAPSTTAQPAQAQEVPALLSACGLLPESEAEALLGQSLPAPSQNTFGAGPTSGSACHYDGDAARLSLIVRTTPPGRTAQEMLDSFVGTQLAVGNRAVEVRAAGEKAAWIASMGQLSVFDPKASLIVICTLKDEKKALETATKVATSALNRF